MDGSADHVDLDGAMEDGRQVFIGGPGDEPTEDPAVVPADKQPKEDQDTRGEESETHQEATVPVSKKEEGADTPPETDKPRFASHEEAEKGYRNVFSAKTKLEQELKSVKSKLEILEKEKEETDRQSKDIQDDQTFMDYATERREKALTEIDDLDPENPDYRKQAAHIWAQVDADIRRKDIELQSARTVAKQKSPAESHTRTPVNEHPDGKYDPEQGREHIRNVISEAGLAKNDPMFWAFASHAPSVDENGTALDLDGQIAWAIDQTNKYRSVVIDEHNRKQDQAANRKGLEHAEKTQSLGRSTALDHAGHKKRESPARVSVDDAVEFSLEQRRL